MPGELGNKINSKEMTSIHACGKPNHCAVMATYDLGLSLLNR
jgi:hypothetical protein